MSLPHLPLRPLITTLIAVLLVGGFLTIRLTRPFAPFRYFQETNITPFTSTLVWTSHQPNRGCILVLTLPLEPKCDPTPRYNHHLTLTNLRSDRTHQVILFSGLNAITTTIDHRFVPNNVPSLPNPAYGKVVTTDTSTPIPGAIVSIKTPRGPRSAVTSAAGTWSLDLGDNYPADTILPVTLDWQAFHLQEHILSVKEHQPAPDFTALTQTQLADPNGSSN